MRNAMDNMVNTLINVNAPLTKKITRKQWEEFQQHWLFDAIKGHRLGQSFCNYFGISNASPLYHFTSNSFCKRWINDNYLNK